MECNSEDFKAVNRWRFAELAPSDLLRSLHRDLSDIDYAEFVRAKWMWTRKPKSSLEGLFAYAVLVFIGVVMLLIPHVGITLAFACSFATLLMVAKDAVRFGRWRQEYESSIGRVIRSRRKGK
jgi:hypothetical protein